MKYGKCLIYAVTQKIKYGGKIKFMWSLWRRWWPHFLWISPKGNTYTYTPITRLGGTGLDTSIFFKGKAMRVLRKLDK